jgi:hypothetical protein
MQLHQNASNGINAHRKVVEATRGLECFQNGLSHAVDLFLEPHAWYEGFRKFTD